MSNLLTVTETAAELNLEEWEVYRAIARNVLGAVKVGGNEYRVTPEQLKLAPTITTLDGPDLDRGWIDDRAESHRASQFAAGVRKEIAAQVPEELPPADQRIGYSGAIRERGEAPPAKRLIASAGQKELPYRSTAETYAVSLVRAFAFAQVKTEPFGSLFRKKQVSGPLGRLYKSPEAYQRITSNAWQNFLAGDIGVRNTWPNPRNPGQPIQRRFYLPHRSITGLDQFRVLMMAF